MAEGRGCLVPVLGRIADWLKPILPMGWLAFVLPILKRSPIAIEVYVLCCFGIALALSAAVWLLYDWVAAVRWFVYILAGLRGLEIIVRAANVDIKTVVDPVRTLVLAAINYVELMLWFGLVYALNYHCLSWSWPARHCFLLQHHHAIDHRLRRRLRDGLAAYHRCGTRANRRVVRYCSSWEGSVSIPHAAA